MKFFNVSSNVFLIAYFVGFFLTPSVSVSTDRDRCLQCATTHGFHDPQFVADVIKSTVKFNEFTSYSRAVDSPDADLWSTWERNGFHMTPVHFYSPLPNFGDITSSAENRAKYIDYKDPLIGIDVDKIKMAQWMKDVIGAAKESYTPLWTPVNDPAERKRKDGSFTYYWPNNMISREDMSTYHSILKFYQPKHVVEVGAGWCTRVSVAALSTQTNNPKLKVIEPYPNEGHNAILRNNVDRYSLEVKKVEEVPISFFNTLRRNDVLLIDSSHQISTGNDVHYEFLHILPSLRKGVIVLIHDIHLPLNYGTHWLEGKRFISSEQYMLQAILQENPNWEILYMPEVARSFPDYESLWPAGADGATSRSGNPGNFIVLRRTGPPSFPASL